MKPTLLALVAAAILTVTIPVHAQTEEFYLQKIEHYKDNQVLGSLLILCSVPSAIITVNLFEKSLDGGDPNDDIPGAKEFFQGIFMTVVSAALFAGGTTMVIIGDNKKRQYKKKLNALKVGLYCVPKQAGLTLTYRF